MFKNIKGDLFGGITAGIVALPLALAFGVQSGMGAIAGLYGAIALGLVAAIFGGTPTQVSGPTGPMTVVSTMIVSSAIETSGSIQSGMGLIIAAFFVAGIFQIVFGLFRIGQYVRYMPYPVLSGFMSGIGVIIILFQLSPLIGVASAKTTLDIVLNIGETLSMLNSESLILGLITIGIIYFFPRLTKIVPSALVALVMVTLFSVLMDFDIPRIGDIPIGIPEVYFSEIFSVQWSQWSVVLQFGATLAALGAIDSLLTSVVADNITKTTHNSNRELIGQGLGNMTAAIIGGLPGAGATMRTVINVNSGGKTRLSGVFHALLLLVVLLGAGKYAALIPKSVLAGILISVGIGIIDYKGFRHLFRVPKSDAVVLVIVLLITIFGNLLNAVAVGMVLASVLFMKKTGDISADKSVVASLGNFERDLPWPDEVELDQKYHNKVFVKHLYGSLFFGFTSKFKEMMNSIPEVELVVFRMDRVPYLDQSGLYALEDVITNLKNKGIRVIFSGLEEQPKDMLSNIKIIPDLVPQTQVFSSIKECSDWIKLNIN